MKPIVVVTDEPDKYPHGTQWAAGVTVHHRDELDPVQRELRETPGVSALIYDQTCASEKRRRRKRGEYPGPGEARVINEMVCEGCGDCSVQVELPLGRAARDRVRPQAHDQPVLVQQGLLLPEGLLPELRHGRGRALRKEGAAGSWKSDSRCPSPRPQRSAAVRNPGHRHRRHRRHHHRPDHRHGGAPRRQGRDRARHVGARAEVRRGHVARADRGRPSRCTRRASPPAAPTWCSAATWSSPRAPRRWRRWRRRARARRQRFGRHPTASSCGIRTGNCRAPTCRSDDRR